MKDSKKMYNLNMIKNEFFEIENKVMNILKYIDILFIMYCYSFRFYFFCLILG